MSEIKNWEEQYRAEYQLRLTAEERAERAEARAKRAEEKIEMTRTQLGILLQELQQAKLALETVSKVAYAVA